MSYVPPLSESNISIDTAFRFMDLPPELRNNVYDLMFEQHASKAPIELSTLPAEMPSDAITRVSKQLRKESLGYYQPAVPEFWRLNAFTLDILQPWPTNLLGELEREAPHIRSANPHFALVTSLTIKNITWYESRQNDINETFTGELRSTFAPEQSRVDYSWHCVDSKGNPRAPSARTKQLQGKHGFLGVVAATFVALREDSETAERNKREEDWGRYAMKKKAKRVI